MSIRAIEAYYAQLRGIQSSMVTLGDFAIDESYHNDYSRILTELRSSVDDSFSGFDLPDDAVVLSRSPHFRGIREPLKLKINQLVNYLEVVHQASNRIVEIGSVYNLIKDAELKSRCSDLLSARDHFDRVINQATQVLEERIRSKLPDLRADTGLTLVGKAINNNPEKTRLRFSDHGAEQEGFAAIFRGLVGAFRNPSHHRFLENVTREQSLQICVFIDNMLAVLDTAEVVDHA